MNKLMRAIALALSASAGANAAEPCEALAKHIAWAPQAKGKEASSAQARSLFDAANAGDEAAFQSLLAAVPSPNDYVIDGDKLLHRLLSPARTLRENEARWRNQHRDGKDPAHWAEQQRKHAALYAAKSRMLALALRAGAAANEAGRDGLAPLHLAALYGNADMARQLVAAGADVRQVSRSDSHEPLEVALQQDQAGELDGIVTADERTATLLVLLDAGAPLPGQRVGKLTDCQLKQRGEARASDKRPDADFRIWNDLLALTRGRAVLDRIAALGTRPYAEGADTLFAFAAWAGNAGGVSWLKENLPRTGKEGNDAWAEGAMWALAALRTAPQGTMDGVLDALLVEGLPWEQHGPGDARSYGSRQRHQPYTPIQGRTLLEHAALSGHTDIVRRLVKLGAPVDSGAGALRQLVMWGEVPMLRTLLELGASPLGDNAEALRLAITPEKWPYTEGLLAERPVTPQQRTEMLRLMLDTLHQRKLALPKETRLLDEALRHAASADGARLARLVLDAGATPDNLAFDSVRNALLSPDKVLFGELLRRGFLRARPDSDDEASKEKSAVLREAILAGRVDVVPALLALRPDLAWRGEDGLSAVDAALRQGDVATVEALLAAGSALDGASLDHALVSGNDGMVRLVAARTGKSVAATCVADTATLARIVRTAGDGWWSALRQQGFGAAHCQDMAPRLIGMLAQDTVSMQFAGWLGERLTKRLAELRTGQPGAALDPPTAELLREPRNALLAKVLRDAGWTMPVLPQASPETRSAAQRAADKKLQAALPGDYELSGREIAGGIRLRRDGTFEYGLVYGGVDEQLRGRWRVSGGKLHLANAPVNGKAMTYTLADTDAEAATAPPPQGQLAVDVHFHDRAVPLMQVTALGDAPAFQYGFTGARKTRSADRNSWRADWTGPVRHIVLAHAEIDNGRPYVFDVPPAMAQRTRFVFRMPDAIPNATFDQALIIKGDTLVWPRDDGNFPFKRKRQARD
ncbi:hypothetical protein OU994_30495 [Pseudoduganella sp. SL102]|uniref:hypothetical protein n=1 Tax=Pseudoduganella sp. SL102 TaxID=2995154 RepID=UPI00248B52A6|nr:hypothetical protein [Pseudoduganella sp. SL102]WBS02521.1 hypothetical protein OU994_30495 [Pseudoduganella sp. SL102]